MPNAISKRVRRAAVVSTAAAGVAAFSVGAAAVGSPVPVASDAWSFVLITTALGMVAGASMHIDT